ncbi:Fc.00g025660.m01.CDS01 [Cosmosporella sp. VM-42]
MPSNESIQVGLTSIEKDKSKVLGVTIGKHTVEPGLYIPKADAQVAPELSFNVPDPAGTYLVVSLDIDAPFPSFHVLGPALHWIQSGLKPEQKNGKVVLTATDPFVANYVGPGPPPGSAPHRYCFFLYEQPTEFDPKAHAPPNGVKMGIWGRMRYSLDDWEKQVSLGPILAANYFTSN